MPGNIRTIYADKEKTNAILPRTKVEAITDNEGNSLSSLLSDKQNVLISGTNIKTINNESILGSGNINTTINKIVDSSSTSVTLAKAEDNTLYIYTQPLTSLTVTTVEDGVTDIIFTSGSIPTVVTLPSGVKKPAGFTIDANKTYELNIMNNLLLVGEWE